MVEMPEEIINGVRVKAVRVEEVFEIEWSGEVPIRKKTKEGFVWCPVFTGYDNGTWEDFLRVQLEQKNKILKDTSEKERKVWGFEDFLTEEELKALAEYCWKNCRNWTGMSHMNYWVFLINNKKVVSFGFRGWGNFMSRVRHKITGRKAKKWDFIEWYW